MKKILMLFVLFVFVGFGSFGFAQETEEIPLEIQYLINPISSLEKDKSGNLFYQIKGKFERTKNEDVYLVLQRTSKSDSTQDYIDLCHFAKSGGLGLGPFAFNYPTCSTNPGLSGGTSYYDYVAYISNESKGSVNIDKDGNLIYFDDIPVSSGNDLVTISNVEFVNNSYFKITGNISESLDGDVTFKVKGTNNSVSVGNIEETLGSISGNVSDFVFDENVLVDPTFETYTIQALYNNQVVGSYVYTSAVTSTDTTDNTSNGTTTDLFADNAVVQGIRGGKGLVKNECGYTDGPNGWKMCGFGDFVSLIQRIIEYIFVLILPIAAIVFAYAGYLFMTSAGDSNKRTAAKNAMTKLVIGIVVVMLAWLIVRLVLKTLGVSSGFTMFLDIG